MEYTQEMVPSDTERFKLPDRAEWVLMRRADTPIGRCEQPVALSLDQALDWIRKEKPILWVGSIFSVPEPASFPSGFSIMKSLFSLILQNAIPGAQQSNIIEQISPRWPLEALLDEFDFLGLDLSESLLQFFNDQNSKSAPTALHEAIVAYYQQGLAYLPLVITTNWDTLLERAFNNNGFTVVAEGPRLGLDPSFGQSTCDCNTIFVYHPHGSFAKRDVVCSYRREQRQLSMDPLLLRHPTLFLGYSGYEPSLYFHLEHDAGQLWCVKDKSDFLIPSKRRLLCRPNTFVYIGDLRELLRALGVLHRDVDLNTKQLALRDVQIPPKVIEILQSRVLCSLASGPSAAMMIHTLLSDLDEPEGTLRYAVLMRTIVEHIRDRSSDTAILGALLASANFRDSEQLWISVLAHLLRHDTDLPMEVIQRILVRSEKAPSSGLGKEESRDDLLVYGFGPCKQRANFYKRFLGVSGTIKDNDLRRGTGSWDEQTICAVTALISGDVAALGEFTEILGFHHLRDRSHEKAIACFDYAATCFYLRGLWNAGALNEWAAANTKKMETLARGRTLLIPAQPEVRLKREQSPT